MEVLTVTNQKGGVGKSTISTNLSYGLATRGKKTLLIDLDPQAHSSIIFGSTEPVNSVSDLFLHKDINIKTTILEAKIEQVTINNLFIIPSNIRLAVVAEQIISKIHKEKILDNHLKKINKAFEFIIIDCPPTLGVLSINGIYVATKILIPTLYSRYALEGIADLFKTIKEVKESTQFEYMIIKNAYDSRNKQTNQFVEAQLAPYKDNIANTVIRRTEAVNKAQINGEPIFSFDSKSNGSEDFKKLTDEILSVTIKR
ncbi:MAG: ParA family protein [Candidatus Falkowbacteria bacterium]